MTLIDRYNDNAPDNDAEEKAFKVIDALSGRSGFDDWFGNIDDDIQDEIINEILEIVK